ncbi:MAG: glyoxylate/hydroxypyruvate reductase A [Bacteroidetes bacterium HGW-Bacteroidetes-17]|jgi:glyoxylate/hydroxypyruvate reductase A|nr:MAG: glyoxylate/hydroxypyruvate reductase A [Bacteroidetes bacterium HGW-Bacteroidetes-17]
MALLIICNDRDLSPWTSALRNIDPKIELRVYPEEGNLEEIEFVLCWKHPRGILKHYPNLKAISSLGAGVDHLLSDPDLPLNIPIVRIVDPELAHAMSEFVIGLIFNHLRAFTQYHENQKQKIWDVNNFQIAPNVHVGIMGMGVLGQDLAIKLAAIGFKVVGWAQSPKEIKNVKVYTGSDEFDEFLSETNILVCLLPLTEKTKNILNKETFSKIQDQAYIINVARGNHLVDEDLIEMIDGNRLSGASLDVFRIEPLPENHPFWAHSKINITPHIASLTNPISVAPQIIENYKRAMAGQPLLNLVSTKLGY